VFAKSITWTGGEELNVQAPQSGISYWKDSLRATGITTHQKNGGRLEDTQELAARAEVERV